MLEEYLTEEKIMINVNASDWRDLVDKVGSLLVQSDDIEPRYCEAMKKVIEEMGPYAVIAPGVVLLHARPEEGVKKLCIAMATLANGINFGSENDPVRLAIALGALDHKTHIELLRDLMKFLQDKQRLAQLFNARDKKTFLKIVLGLYD